MFFKDNFVARPVKYLGRDEACKTLSLLESLLMNFLSFLRFSPSLRELQVRLKQLDRA